MSHSLIVSSAEPEARIFPSGLNATDKTTSVWPSRVRTSLPVADIPQLDRLVPGAGGEELAVGAERHGQ
jgi:hypothetical protein